jgi:ABC-2 type transport system ATP-binding protein
VPDATTPPRRALFLRHHTEDDPGLVGAALERRGFLVDVELVDDGAAPVALDGVDVLGVLGSKWSVYDHDAVGGWLDVELDAIRRADRLGVPVLGICFGAQALCVAMGGVVERAPRAEIGWTDLEGAPGDGLPEGPWLEFHEDRCLPPATARVLAANDVGVQAFRVGRHLGVQFHPELEHTQLQRWYDAGADQAARAAGVDPVVLLEATRSLEGPASRRVDALVEGFLARAEPVVEVEGLRRSYGDLLAVGGVSFSIERGTCTALLGPNGAGKTTTVEILEGYRHRDGGDVSVLGTDPAGGNRAWRQRLGIVPQDCKDLLELTVAECVSYFATLFPAARTPASTIALVGLTDKADARVSTLSGGQRRRLDVALGIVGDPELLFLDEPTTGFDPEARRAFWELIRALKAEGTTILLTTHYMEEADALADRIIVVNHGNVVADAPPTELGERGSEVSIVRYYEDGEVVERETATPTTLIAELHAALGELDGLEVRRPTLEDVYLKLVEEGASR